MITIVFSTSKNPISALIRWFTNSTTSHALIGIEFYGVPLLLEATIGGVKAYPRDKFIKDNKIVNEFEIIPDVSEGIKYAIESIGEKYDYIGLIGYIPIIIFRWFNRRIKNPLASSQAVICSEFVMMIDKNNIIKEWRDLDPESTSPADLLESCLNSNNFKMINS